MKEEIWEPVVGYEGKYEVSDLGRVRSVDRHVFQQGKSVFYNGVIMTPSVNNSGYLTIRLSRNNKKKGLLIHRIVAEAFLENPNGLPCVNHKDENKLNNNLQNLEWCTMSYNVNYGTATIRRARKMGNKIAQYNLKGNLVATYYSSGDAERNTGIAKSAIKDCANGKTSTSGGYIWKKIIDSCPQHVNVLLPCNHAKVIEQYDVNLNFIASYDSGHIAAKDTGLCSENILACCRRQQKSCGGYIWAFQGEEPAKISPRKNQKCVVMADLDDNNIKKFDSIASASKFLGGNRSAGIKQCLYGKSKSAYGYKWRYA